MLAANSYGPPPPVTTSIESLSSYQQSPPFNHQSQYQYIIQPYPMHGGYPGLIGSLPQTFPSPGGYAGVTTLGTPYTMYGYPQAITTQQILVPSASNGNGVFQGSNFGPSTTFGIGPSGLPVIIPSGIQPSQTGSGAISGYGSSAGIGVPPAPSPYGSPLVQPVGLPGLGTSTGQTTGSTIGTPYPNIISPLSSIPTSGPTVSSETSSNSVTSSGTSTTKSAPEVWALGGVKTSKGDNSLMKRNQKDFYLRDDRRK
ncbi:hypothetical protein WR25_04162 [Diploscapter pachys]|uniref:Uncharacterized protein n=1 Tax=Diploscapter pachys TaxID=2018661 RepID=A0A2A2J4L3_9BILA|nr:hypothetical protein WR25_04162 [Diploscapter pachys]